jgi:hypothetical protein
MKISIWPTILIERIRYARSGQCGGSLRMPSTSEIMKMKSVVEWIFSRICITVMSNTDMTGSIISSGTLP